ncbi:MAG: shikimate kinase [Planctomycetota bacterium]
MVSKPNLYLIGYRGSGKSTLAPRIASLLGFQCVDTDRLLETQLGEPISDFFKRCGESEFRRIESQTILQVSKASDQVISLGGGAVLASENRDLICQTGKVVWLRCSLDTLAARLNKDQSGAFGRPSLTGKGVVEEIQEVLQVREPIYQEMADWIVDADAMDPHGLCEQIVRWWKVA